MTILGQFGTTDNEHCFNLLGPTVSDGFVDGWPPVSLSKLGPWALDPGFGVPERALERRGAAATPPMGVRVGVECCSLRIAIERRSGRATSLPERRAEPRGVARYHYRLCEPG